MWHKITFILCLVSIYEPIYAQQTIDPKDSTQIYKKIENFSKKRKFTRLIYPMVLRSVDDTSKRKGSRARTYKKLIKKPYSLFEGKIIRHINIETLDPFGHSINDTLAAPTNFFPKAGNKMHIKSNHLNIRNLLLIRQNQIFDSLLVKESERLVRSRSYVRDVSFTIKATSPNSDSVDIFIREIDNWSIIPDGGSSSSQSILKLTDKNFLGLGHESQNSLAWFHTNGDFLYNLNYFIPNIRNTYINATFHYGTDEYLNFVKSVSVDRPFFSPFARWAAGVAFKQQMSTDTVLSSEGINIKFNVQDYWLGSSVQIFKGNTENHRTTNFISAIRFLRIRYIEKPIESVDTMVLYSDQNFYLASIGISTRKYVQDKFIFKYGTTEDVPIGQSYSITCGYQDKNNLGRFYIGARFSLGNYYQWGYLSSNFEYGSFFNKSIAEEGVIYASLIYFTGLKEIGRWKFRQFVKPQLTIGINRREDDSLTINDGYGLDGFQSPLLSGTQRLLFTLQTQSYAPWQLLGFRFGPYLVCALGMLGNANKGFKGSKVYSQIGLGLLIKNENLVINTFQISVAFYPIIPGDGRDVFKMNSFKTSDFRFRDFEIGKPSNLAFQ